MAVTSVLRIRLQARFIVRLPDPIRRDGTRRGNGRSMEKLAATVIF